jgi:hypothetical protein
MKLTPNITLSNGRVIGSRYAENGSQDLFDVADPERVANLTDAEHAEVMVAIREFRNPRMFAGCYPCGIVYADRFVEVAGDYKRVAFLPYSTLNLEIDDPKSPILEQVKADAAQYVAGQPFQVAGNYRIILGEKN